LEVFIEIALKKIIGKKNGIFHELEQQKTFAGVTCNLLKKKKG